MNNNSNIKFSALSEELQNFNKFVKEVYNIYPDIKKSDFLKHLDGDAQILFLKKSMDQSKSLEQIIEELGKTFQSIQKSDLDCFLEFPKQKFTNLESLISKFIIINEGKDLEETFRIHIFLDSLPPILRYEVSKCDPSSVEEAIAKTRLVESCSVKCFKLSLFNECSSFNYNKYQTPFINNPSIAHHISSISSNGNTSSGEILNGSNNQAISILPSSGPSISSRSIDWKPRQYYGSIRGQVVCFYCGIIGHKEVDCRKKIYNENRKRLNQQNNSNLNNNKENNSSYNTNQNNNSNNTNQNNNNLNNNNENNNTNNNNNNNRRINIKANSTRSNTHQTKTSQN